MLILARISACTITQAVGLRRDPSTTFLLCKICGLSLQLCTLQWQGANYFFIRTTLVWFSLKQSCEIKLGKKKYWVVSTEQDDCSTMLFFFAYSNWMFYMLKYLTPTCFCALWFVYRPFEFILSERQTRRSAMCLIQRRKAVFPQYIIRFLALRVCLRRVGKLCKSF